MTISVSCIIPYSLPRPTATLDGGIKYLGNADISYGNSTSLVGYNILFITWHHFLELVQWCVHIIIIYMYLLEWRQ